MTPLEMLETADIVNGKVPDIITSLPGMTRKGRAIFEVLFHKWIWIMHRKTKSVKDKNGVPILTIKQLDLCEACGVSIPTLRSHINNLIKLGVVIETKQPEFHRNSLKLSTEFISYGYTEKSIAGIKRVATRSINDFPIIFSRKKGQSYIGFIYEFPSENSDENFVVPLLSYKLINLNNLTINQLNNIKKLYKLKNYKQILSAATQRSLDFSYPLEIAVGNEFGVIPVKYDSVIEFPVSATYDNYQKIGDCLSNPQNIIRTPVVKRVPVITRTPVIKREPIINRVPVIRPVQRVPVTKQMLKKWKSQRMVQKYRNHAVNGLAVSDWPTLDVIMYFNYLATRSLGVKSYSSISFTTRNIGVKKQQNWRHFQRTRELCDKEGIDYKLYLEAQFDRAINLRSLGAINKSRKIPYPSSLYSTNAMEYYKRYVQDSADSTLDSDGAESVRAKMLEIKDFQREIADTVNIDCDKYKRYLKRFLFKQQYHHNEYIRSMSLEDIKVDYVKSQWRGISPYYLVAVAPWIIDDLNYWDSVGDTSAADKRERIFNIVSSKTQFDLVVRMVKSIESQHNL